MRAQIAAVGSLLKGIVSGKSVKTLDRAPQEGELGILKVSAVTWGEFRPSESKAMPSGYDPGACPRPMDQDILISRANTRELVGAPVMVRGDHPHLLLSDKILKLIPDEAVVDRRYLVRALRSPTVMKHFFQRAGGSSGSMTNITQADIRDAEIFLPDLPEQRRIAAILDQADALRAKRREALAQLDRLTQAIFIDMFGDETVNSHGWPVQALSSVVADDDNINYGVVQPGDDVPNGVPLVRVSDLREGKVAHDALKRIDEQIERAYSRSRLRGDEILLSCVGSVGVVALATEAERGFNIARAVARIRVSPRADRTFIAAQLQSKRVQRYFTQELRTVSQPTLNIKQIAETEIVCPPLELQREFAHRAKEARALEVRYQVSASEFELLFASLQHRAFRGEL